MVIFDYGCAAALTGPALFGAVKTVLACLVVLTGMAALGRLIVQAPQAAPTQVYTGWAIVALALNLAAAAPVALLFPTATSLLAAMGLALIASSGRDGSPHGFDMPLWLLALFPGLIILTMIALHSLASGDDFAFAVPNALYLSAHDALPQLAAHVATAAGERNLPAPPSLWPGYPYALAFLSYLAAQIGGGFAVQAGAMFNFLMLAAFAATLAELRPGSREILRRDHWPKLSTPVWAALALLLVTLGNPGFDARIAFTNNGVTGTMVIAGALLVMLARMIEALAAYDMPTVAGLRIEIALCGALLMLIQPGNGGLLALLLFSFVVAMGRSRVLRRGLREIPGLAIVAITTWLLWNHYVMNRLGANPLLTPQLPLWNHAEISAKPLDLLRNYAPMLGAVFCAVVALTRAVSMRSNLVLMAGVICAGWLELRAAGAVGPRDGVGGDEISLIYLTSFWAIAQTAWQELRRKRAQRQRPQHRFTPLQTRIVIYAMTGALLAILPAVVFIEPTWLIPKAGPQICAVRAEGQALAKQLVGPARVGLLDPEGDGRRGAIINFELALSQARDKKNIVLTWQGDRQSLPDDTSGLMVQAKKQLAHGTISALYIPCAQSTPISFMGMDNRTSALLVTAPDGTAHATSESDWKVEPLPQNKP